MNKYVAAFVLLTSAALLSSQPGGPEQPGPQPGGFTLLPNGWSIQPAGAQIPLDTLPMSTALSPDGRYLLVLNAGYRPPSISVLTTTPVKEIARVPVADAWLGLTFAPGGKLVYASGGSRGSVFEFSFSPDGELKPLREMPATAEHGELDIIGDVATDGHLIYAAELLRDSIAVINPQSGRVIEHWKTGRRPHRILFAPDAKTFFVSSWADASIYLHNATTGEQIARLGLGPHTTDMVLSARKSDRGDDDDDPGGLPAPAWNYRLFVAAANTNNVYVVGVGDNNTLRLLETLNVALTPREPAGMTPSAVALSADQKRLFVVCSDANAVAVVDVSSTHSQVQGFIPTGWYPTAARALSNDRVAILNGRGLSSQPNPTYGGSPKTRAPNDPRAGYVGNLQRGTMSVVESFSDEKLDEYSATVRRGARYKDSDLDAPAGVPEDSVIYSRPGRPSPIEHVIYIIKENRTYDQVLGKLGKGNGDPSLTLFDENAAPNHYKLAREFVLFDNFYVNADVSADGHNWSTAAIATDFTQKLWPFNYGGRSKYYGFEGHEPANLPPAGYLWTNALSAGLTVRNYGEFFDGKVGDPALENITNKNYRGFDTTYPDTERAKVFLEDLRQFESANAMPRLIVMHLPNDHTSGTTPGRIAPLSAFADNDAALGTIVEAVSHTKFWPKTAIFVLEDDAQDGPDHVDSHRSIAFVVSPYTRRGTIDSSMYNTASMLRTMELILGLRPMTHFDAGARVMSAAFLGNTGGATANTAPYAAEKARISLTDRNPDKSTTAARSLKLDFSDADRVPDDELNEILWLTIKGTEPPAPKRSYFSR